MMKIRLSKIALALGFIASASVLNVANAASLVGLTTSNQLAFFDSTNVAASTLVGINGLSGGERLVGIDLRPSNNTIYGVSDANNIYTLSSTGQATFVAGLRTVSGDVSTPYSIRPSVGYGFDFNPVADFAGGASLRFINTAGDNLAINVNTGAAVAGVVGNTASNIGTGYSAAAYTNSTPNGSLGSTQLYYINSDTNTLSRHVPVAGATGTTPGASFNAPNIVTVGNLGLGAGVDIVSADGFEIFSDSFAFAALTIVTGPGARDAATNLYSINLQTGQATLAGLFNGTLRGLTAAPSAVPVPAAAWLFGSALLGLAGFRRKFA
ncbi:MAG: DUF4394 domain-containing protein [Methylotenera sp.]|nr:DUF4394 domain-containing protein [Methylotenera sp.]